MLSLYEAQYGQKLTSIQFWKNIFLWYKSQTLTLIHQVW